MEIRILNEETRHIEQVREIVQAAFPSDAECKLVDAMRANNKAAISLVAVQDGQVLGHILFSPVSITPPGAAKGVGLAPLAVHPAFQKLGIGSRLIREGLRLCKELGYDYCVVLGAPDYYRRFGFETANKYGIENEYGVDEEFMLTRFSAKADMTGRVKYASEFSKLGV